MEVNDERGSSSLLPLQDKRLLRSRRDNERCPEPDCHRETRSLASPVGGHAIFPPPTCTTRNFTPTLPPPLQENPVWQSTGPDLDEI